MDDNIRILAVDPGNGLGVAVIDHDIKTKKSKVLDAYTLDLSRYIPNSDDIDKRDISLQRLIELKRFLKSYLKVWRPMICVHETAFVPRGNKGASIYSYASLIENILSIKFSFIESSRDMRIFEINPNTVKMCVVGFKSPDKNLILEALIKDDLVDLSNIDTKSLNQHNADAIAIGVTFIKEHVISEYVGENYSFRIRGV